MLCNKYCIECFNKLSTSRHFRMQLTDECVVYNSIRVTVNNRAISKWTVFTSDQTSERRWIPADTTKL